MTRVLAHYVSFEMAMLGLVELLLSFLLIAGVLHVSGNFAPLSASDGLGSNLTPLAAMLALTTGGIAATAGLYRPETCLERQRLIGNAAAATVVAFPIMLAVSGQFRVGLSVRMLLLAFGLLAAWQISVLLTRLLFAALVQRESMLRQVQIIGSGERAEQVATLLRSRLGRLYELVNHAEPLAAGGTEHLWGVIVAGEAVTAASPRGARVLTDTAFLERYFGRINLDDASVRQALLADAASGRWADSFKRMADIVISLLLLILALPVMAITALLIALESPGPILYRQQRAGLHGRPFTLFKFRSMSVDAESNGQPQWAQRADPRITRVGSIIRPLRIDELPQLLNVLRGEMSMVGPRPERPIFVEHLDRVIPLYRQRASMKPGITGWAQVNYPYGASVEDAREKLAYDLYYVKNHGPMLDLLILLATVRVILFREGAR